MKYCYQFIYRHSYHRCWRRHPIAFSEASKGVLGLFGASWSRFLCVNTPMGFVSNDSRRGLHRMLLRALFRRISRYVGWIASEKDVQRKGREGANGNRVFDVDTPQPLSRLLARPYRPVRLLLRPDAQATLPNSVGHISSFF